MDENINEKSILEIKEELNIPTKPYGNFYFNKCVKVIFATGETVNYNCKMPVQLGSTVVVNYNSHETKGVVIEVVGKLDSLCQNVIKIPKAIDEENANTPCLEFVLSPDEDYYIVDKYNDIYETVIIPDVYKGLPVKAINQKTFVDNRYLRSITISKNIEEINLWSFYNCTKLEKVIFESSETKIAEKAFRNCRSLKSINLPANLETIEADSFLGCYSLTDIEIPKSVKTIGYDAFEDCKALKNVYYGGTIEDWCNINFHYIHSNPVYFAKNLYLLDENGDAEYNGKKYKLLKEVILPDTLTEIKHLTFYGFNNLYNIKIPHGVQSIGQYAFAESSLKSIEIPNTVNRIFDDAFKDCEKLISVDIQEGVTKIGRSAFSYCEKLISVSIPDTVTELDDAFFHCLSLENVVLPSKITFIDDMMFCQCEKLKSVKIPHGVERIGYSAFSGCESLESVEIPDSVTIIENEVFSICRSLENIILPSSVTYIGYSAFDRYTKIYYQGSYDNWVKVEKKNIASLVYVLDENGQEIFEGKKYTLV